MKTTFESLGLSDSTLKAIENKGFKEPSPIQEKAIPYILQETKDLIAQAQTGTGKTAAFGLPLMDLIDPKKKNVQALILAPTRELAVQVAEEMNSIQDKGGLKILPVYGGQSIDVQLRKLRAETHIVVGTPGRVIDHLKRKSLDLAKISFLVLDEADEMLNMGFVEELEEILKFANPEKRTILFSATMPVKIKELSKKYMKEPETIAVKKKQLTTNLTKQIYFEVQSSDRFEALCRVIDVEDDFYGIIFFRTRNDVDNVQSKLIDRGYASEAIHGDISQVNRERALDKFKKKKINILVATDVAARGIDVNQLTHVVNYALPQDPESYVHRIGRTGRAGHQGTAISFISPSEYRKFMFIQKVTNTEIEKATIPEINEIIEVKKKRIEFNLNKIQKDGLKEEPLAWAEKILEEHNPQEVIASLLTYSFAKDLDTRNYRKIKEISQKRNVKSTPVKKAIKNPVRPLEKSRLHLARGKKDKMSLQKVTELISEKVSMKRKLIENLEIKEDATYITVPASKAKEILQKFKSSPHLFKYAHKPGPKKRPR